ncbi:MAG TPA: hypothetical protein VFQ85_12555 [Mycobacteriales bacterium]|jgi:hypothetical protein|nr:hypothetical protein [Mycobacteriales bacterium]
MRISEWHLTGIRTGPWPAWLLLALTAAVATAAVVADRTPLLAVAVLLMVAAAVAAAWSRRPAAVFAAVAATAVLSVAWTVAESSTRHVLVLTFVPPPVLSALLFLRWYRTYLPEPDPAGTRSSHGV